MVQRVRWGAHPLTTGTGLYVSRPGVDVLTIDPDNVSDWPDFALNTKAGKQANVIQAGTATQDVTVTHPAIGGGAIPFVFFQRRLSTGFNPHEIRRISNGGISPTQYEHQSRWTITQTATTFQIIRAARTIGDPITGASFRYVVFNLPVR